jgi:hypothetical protein
MTLDDLDITINNRKLTTAQKMTVHAAIQSFAMYLKGNILGDDETGKSLTKGYLASIYEINKIIQQS